jgi:hypothetical protein
MTKQRIHFPQPRNENFKYEQTDKEPRAAASSFRFTSCTAQKKLTSEIHGDTKNILKHGITKQN